MSYCCTYRVQSDGTLVRIRQANGRIQKNRDGTLKKADRRYIPTDPVAVIRDLMKAGFYRIESKALHNGFVTLLTARYPATGRYPNAPTDSDYRDYVSLLLDHRGRCAFTVQLGSLRMACTNEFVAPPVKINHTDPDLREVLNNLPDYLRSIRYMAGAMRSKVEGLHGVGCAYEVARFWEERKPRLAKKIRVGIDSYAYRRPDTALDHIGTHDLWAAVQSMTATKSPVMVQAAGTLIEAAAKTDTCNGLPEDKLTWIPDRWFLEFPLEGERQALKKAASTSRVMLTGSSVDNAVLTAAFGGRLSALSDESK